MKKQNDSLSRRRFIQTSLAGSAALAGAALNPVGQAAAQEEATFLAPTEVGVDHGPLPMRKLGKTGREVTILNTGGMMQIHGPKYLDMCWNLGIRYFDTADCYKGGQSERDIAAWIGNHPERREELFLVTKDHPRNGPQELLTMIDKRLEALKTDYVDLFFIHGISPKEYGAGALEWPKSKELKDVAESLKKSGKIKFFGFSCHDAQKTDFLNAAAEGGFIDAIMVKYSPFRDEDPEFERALDACHKAGIGLISMKEMRGLKNMPKQTPEFETAGLTTAQALLHAVWSDERIASICSSIDNMDYLFENTLAARSYKVPLAAAQIESLRRVAMASEPTFCPNCDGRCQKAAGTQVALNDIARYVSYYEQDGNTEARDWYRALSEQERYDPSADLAAAQDACQCKMEFAKIMQKAERYFG
jgi:predicted aldo/keto reductase-like oxidoreductase